MLYSCILLKQWGRRREGGGGTLLPRNIRRTADTERLKEHALTTVNVDECLGGGRHYK